LGRHVRASWETHPHTHAGLQRLRRHPDQAKQHSGFALADLVVETFGQSPHLLSVGACRFIQS